MYPRIGVPPHLLDSCTLCGVIGVAVITLLTVKQLEIFSVNKDTGTKILVSIPFAFGIGTAAAYITNAMISGWSLKNGGLSFYGWLAGCVFFFTIYARLNGLEISFLLNLFLPTCLPALAVWRIGCFLGGCCYGIPGEFAAVRYPAGSLPHRTYGDAALLPVQLFESGCLFAAAVIVFRVKFPYRSGIFFIILGVIRFAMEFLRGDDRGDIFDIQQLSPSQIFSMAAIAAGILLFVRNNIDIKQKG